MHSSTGLTPLSSKCPPALCLHLNDVCICSCSTNIECAEASTWSQNTFVIKRRCPGFWGKLFEHSITLSRNMLITTTSGQAGNAWIQAHHFRLHLRLQMRSLSLVSLFGRSRNQGPRANTKDMVSTGSMYCAICSHNSFGNRGAPGAVNEADRQGVVLSSICDSVALESSGARLWRCRVG